MEWRSFRGGAGQRGLGPAQRLPGWGTMGHAGIGIVQGAFFKLG